MQDLETADRQTDPDDQERGDCLTMPYHYGLAEQSAEYRDNARNLEVFTRLHLRLNAGAGLRTGVVKIPVVVHVVYKTANQNISDTQIYSQIDVLNRDFRKLNPDIASVPACFLPLAADARIEFALAERDPSCNATTGIERRETTVVIFGNDASMAGTQAGDPVKFFASGGLDAWPADKYLNIWVCNLPVSKGGYAQKPGGPAATDGIVVDYQAFGVGGTTSGSTDGGRTAVHEVGHWLNLLHIWGDDQDRADRCSGSDGVDDTPNQRNASTGAPTFPQVSCMNGPNGDMFMNYMDTSRDSSICMFTAGQVERMDAALDGPRASILASDGLIPPVSGGTADLWSADTPADVGAEPDPVADAMWASDDIWVRRQQDGLTVQAHQNPEYRPATAGPNYVYVRVRNRACGTAGQANVTLYWAKASTALSWTPPWDGSVTVPALMGGTIGTKPTGVVNARGYTILEYPWYPPNPLDYVSFGLDQAHFCLLARIVTPAGMTFPETTDLELNVRKNNNIVWKNLTIVEVAAAGSASMAWAGIGGPEREDELSVLAFRAVPEIPTPLTDQVKFDRPSTIFDWGTVRIDLGAPLFALWRDGGARGDGIQVDDDGLLRVLGDGAWIGGLHIRKRDLFSVRLEFTARRAPANEIYLLDLIHEVGPARGDMRILGGLRFALTSQAPLPRNLGQPATTRFDGVDWVPIATPGALTRISYHE